MISYDLAIVEDRGTYWSVQGVTKNSLSTADQSEQYLKLSVVSFKKIEKALLEGDEVRIIKPLSVGEVLPNEVKIFKTNTDDLTMVRASAIKRVRVVINPTLVSVSGMTFYGFICLNNELADKGYFITDENRESKYLAILETGDEKLIEKLENYLNYRDEIARAAFLNNKFNDFRRKVNEEQDPAIITKLADEFLEMFYAGF